MKKLRLFDSLKFMLAAVACVFILNVAHADTTAIQSVIAYGKTEQSGTPTPTNPVPIMTNNGELRVSRNLFDSSLFDTTATGILYHSFSIPNGTYTMSTNFPAVSSGTTNVFIFAGRVSSGASSPNNGVSANVPRTITVTDGYYTVAYRSGISGAGNANNPKDFDWMLEKGSTATPYEPYGTVIADGLTETIRDSAGHTATAQMLLSVGDYKDEQNITTGAITRRVGVKVFDGTEIFNSSVLTGCWTLSESLGRGNFTDRTVYCTHFNHSATLPPASDRQGYAIIGNNGNTYSVGFCATTRFSTVDEWKQFLADQYAAGTPVIVVYPLATETTENVTTQTLTTAPVRQTAGSILGMPIEVVLGDGTREWVRDMITIATTRYNEEQFEPVQNRLSDAMNAVDDVVSRTMSQAQAIDQIATNKQTRPDEGCMAKYCLLVEDEDGTPHWYPIAGANGVAHNLPNGYTELQYIESDGASWIDTGIAPTATTLQIDYKMQILQKAYVSLFGAVAGTTPRNGFRIYYQPSDNTNSLTFQAGAATVNQAFTWNDVLEGSVVVKQGASIVSTINGNTINQASGANLTQSATILVGTSYVGSNVSGLTPMKIWSFKITKNGAVVFNGVPAKNANDEIGMYDLADSNPATAFHTNAGTGEFVAGPDM